ncbi:hypothetical protein ERJ75_001653800 [Trypanosoma vivax]|nr:hypothetical protein ERJ75_001653800 [Trypanosoma vivax]
MLWTAVRFVPKCLSGVIVSWHPFERRGSIRCDDDGRVYVIPNARAFETILTSRTRSLEGAKVKFAPLGHEREVENVITRSRLDPITENSYKQPSPVDFLSAFRVDQDHEVQRTEIGGRRSENPLEPGKTHSSASCDSFELVAGNIVVDLNTLAGTTSTCVVGEERLGDEELMGGLPSPLGKKDLRNAVVLDADTKELLRLRRQVGDESRAREIFQERRRKEIAEKAQERVVLAELQTGIVLSWSQLYRSGVILAGATVLPDATSASDDAAEVARNICIIRNVDAFETALPTMLNLVGCTVTFTKVKYGSQSSSVFAECITVSGVLDFDSARTSATEAKTKEAAEAELAARKRRFGALFFEEEEDNNEPPPTAPLYGVITRWSGGQGVVETGNGRQYYIRSAADFLQLIDQKSSAVRGAVVRFNVDSENRRNAREVDVLSLAVRSPLDMVPTLEKREPTKSPVGRSAGVEEVGCGTTSAAAGGGSSSPPPETVQWVHGMVVTWSQQEGQGVIEGDDGIRYVLRDAEAHIVNYETCKFLLNKGRRVKFVSCGISGRLASNVVLFEEEADESVLVEAELQLRQPRLSDGHADEAIASPMSTAYWIGRMDKAGFDTSEVKKMQGKAIAFEEDDNDDKLLDSEDLFKKDHWFNDPRKNIRLPNSDVTAGNLALIGPASMMNIAMKAHNPKKLEKMKDKYYNRLTEPMKEYAWKQAKELAPKYEKRIKEAREKGEEPRFTFY